MASQHFTLNKNRLNKIEIINLSSGNKASAQISETNSTGLETETKRNQKLLVSDYVPANNITSVRCAQCINADEADS